MDVPDWFLKRRVLRREDAQRAAAAHHTSALVGIHHTEVPASKDLDAVKGTPGTRSVIDVWTIKKKRKIERHQEEIAAETEPSPRCRITVGPIGKAHSTGEELRIRLSYANSCSMPTRNFSQTQANHLPSEVNELNSVIITARSKENTPNPRSSRGSKRLSPVVPLVQQHRCSTFHATSNHRQHISSHDESSPCTLTSLNS